MFGESRASGGWYGATVWGGGGGAGVAVTLDAGTDEGVEDGVEGG